MPFNIAEARKDLQTFDLKKLFIEKMGWDIAKQTIEVPVYGEYFQLRMVAQKHGLAAFVCSPMADGSIPDSALRNKIETQVRKIAHEHLIIFTNKDKAVQKWQWVRREHGKPIARREYDFTNYQKGDALLHRLQAAAFELDEEDALTIIEVGQRVRSAFDLEKVTKKFYDRFKAEHTAFLKFIKGIPDKEMQQWYVSVTLNRLMFVYFIQKKQFLNNDPNYLRHHLEESKENGTDLFYTDFLCPLFFDGFARKERTAKVKKLFGNIPYLNGGIFEQHQIEERYGEKIEIPDKAFEQLFEFFDDYRWHLDERTLKEGNEINPDVLGYIFEKYINQKQMGAYYTKEDITGYISKNTIIPHIFDVAQKECKVAFEGEGSIWRHLQADPDRYIYDAVKHGIVINIHENPHKKLDTPVPFPPEIAVGLNDPQRREGWNKAARVEAALPTEIWREVVARRRRYQEVTEKLADGSVRSINDLITFNLDIRQFAQDAIEDSDADLLTAFWHALKQIKILDPTVGSGAFLFAALNVLEPMYAACLERMTALVKELDASGEKHSPKKYDHFRKALEQVHEHPDENYFIFKSIIINNLYGVDIMDEAVEICKLRLFLKLAAQVEPDPLKENLGIEPLPDIDFNIRAGNTLVGFATREDVKRSVQMVGNQQAMVFGEEKSQLQRIEEKAEEVDRLYKAFRLQQTVYGGEVNAEDKKVLEKKLKALDDELNILLSRQYAIHNPKGKEFKEFLESHKPFHWFVEYYGIMREGGFDVIIGNPPYVEYSKVEKEYQLQNYKTLGCGNLYAYISEKCLNISNSEAKIGLIVPMAFASTKRMQPASNELIKQSKTVWCSHYAGDSYPGTLFNGVKAQLSIVLSHKGNAHATIYSSRYRRWFQDERDYVFVKLIEFNDVTNNYSQFGIVRIGEEIETDILGKIKSRKPLGLNLNREREDIYYRNYSGSYYRLFFDKEPPFIKNNINTRSNSISVLGLRRQEQKHLLLGALSSTLFYWYHQKISDAWHVSHEHIDSFGFESESLDIEEKKKISGLAESLMKDLWKNAKWVHYNRLGETNDYQEFYARRSKPIIDEIDHVLARHYGLTDEELDFIINYDVKYRMGVELEEEEA